jgi:hypothetical protein
MKLLTSFLTLLLLLFSLKGATNELKGPAEKIAIVTAPKSGTHLFKKLLSLLVDQSDFCVIHSDRFLHEPGYLQQYPKRILLIRDPRDVCISWVNYVDQGLLAPPPAFPQNILDLSSEKKRSWQSLSFDDKLMHTIRKSPSKAWKEAGLDSSLVTYPILPYEDALTLMKQGDENTLICKFENLIGQEGGGSKEAQRAEILKIVNFLNLEISEKRLDDAIAHLFGGTDTFYQGKIGKWKTMFTKKHKKVFKQKRNQLLVEFGYETDDRW